MRLTIPNQLTILRIILTPVFLFLLVKKTPGSQLTASAVFCVAAFTDWYDGWHARRFGVISRIGQFMDPLADKILVISAYIIFAVLGYIMTWMVWVIVIRDSFITLTRIFAIQAGSPIITHGLAKWKTAAQMGTIFIVLAFINWRNYYGDTSVNYTANYTDIIGISMLTVTILTIVSGVIYFIENRELLLNLLRKIIRL